MEQKKPTAEQLKAAKAAFSAKDNLKAKSLHVTSDNQCFIGEHYAREHAKTLTDNSVVEIERSEIKEEPKK